VPLLTEVDKPCGCSVGIRNNLQTRTRSSFVREDSEDSKASSFGCFICE
jgi:hypothetical protein